MTLEQFVEAAAKRAEKVFYKQGHFLPLYHAVKRDGQELFRPMPPFRDKVMAVAVIRAFFELEDVVRYVFINECWTYQGPDSSAMQLAIDLAAQSRLSEHPDRKEILGFVAEDQDGGMLIARREIIRTDDKARLGPLKVESGGRVEGRMVGLLPKRGCSH